MTKGEGTSHRQLSWSHCSLQQLDNAKDDFGQKSHEDGKAVGSHYPGVHV